MDRSAQVRRERVVRTKALTAHPGDSGSDATTVEPEAICGAPATEALVVPLGAPRAVARRPPSTHRVEDIPTLKDQGYDVTVFGWWGVAVPKGVPDSIRQKLYDSFRKGMDEPPFTDWMSKNKYTKVYLNATDTLAQWKREMAMYGDMAKTLKK